MRKLNRTLVFNSLMFAIAAGCASAQGSTSVPTVASTPRTATPASTRPLGYVGFTIKLLMSARIVGDKFVPGSPGNPVIDAVDPGSPADKAGLAPGDVILEVNGTDARKEGTRSVPAPGVKEILRIRHGQEEREVVLVALPLPNSTARHP